MYYTKHTMNITFPGSSLNDEFATLCNKHVTDKVSYHGYQRYYSKFIQHYKDVEDGAVLEIGVGNYGSLNVWSDFFPKAHVFGIDLYCENMDVFNEKRQKTFVADQSKKEDLEMVCSKVDKPVFLIVDDGSHHPSHQLQTFDIFFTNLLVPGGTYVIEDVETSYWTKNHVYGYETNYGFHSQNSLIEIFKLLVEDINREFLTSANKVTQSKLLKSFFSIKTRLDISTITFGKNCIFITKKTTEEKELYDNLYVYNYRFSQNL